MPLPLKVRFSSIVTLSLRTTFPLILPPAALNVRLSKVVMPVTVAPAEDMDPAEDTDPVRVKLSILTLSVKVTLPLI